VKSGVKSVKEILIAIILKVLAKNNIAIDKKEVALINLRL
tara:strand:- start:481 stop:600 length:120 start_codon:yes stop_codon:yes gene_type:complete